MHRSQHWILAFLGLCGLLLAVAACREPSPEERTASIRSRYSATLNGFVVRQEPAGEALAEAPESAAAAAVEEEEEEEAVPIKKDVILDILIRHDSHEKLPGLTLDISHAGPDGREKNHWRLWVDTSAIERGPGTQITHILEDLDYQEGDGFHVEVRHPVPPEERGEYREFSALTTEG